jgi:foldase protein PrsA
MLATLAVAVTVAGPAYSGTIEERQIERLAQREGETPQALRMLIQRHWLEGEAVERGIVVTRREVEDEFETDVEESFRTRKAFKAFLKRTKQTEADIKATIRSDLLSGAIKAQVAEPAAKSVTPDQVKAYVDANPQTLPARRTVRFVATKNRRAARAVLRKLRRGATWASVHAGKRTFDQAEETAAGRAIFRAPLNRTTRYGRIVFRVIRHTSERPEPRAQQEARAWEVLASEAQQRALDAFVVQFTAKWRERTTCAPSYSDHEDCGQPPTGQQAP